MKCQTCGREAGGMAIPLGAVNPKRWAFDCLNCGDHWTATLVEETILPPAKPARKWWEFWL